MRKNLIALSIAAFVGGLGMAGGAAAAVILDDGNGDLAGEVSATPAQAQRVRQSGIGHQLIVPYYNTQVGNATLFNVVNTDTVNGKAVKIRFRGGSNSDDVLDFQLFLSPGDVWAANISQGADGRATLTTRDRSCTLPAGVGAGAGSPFVTARLPGSLSEADKARETREGYIEIFNMADIPPRMIDTDGSSATTANPLFTAIKHVAGVAPCTVATLNNLGTPIAGADNTERLTDARSRGFRGPTTGLFANWTIVNVPKAGSASGEATALTATIGAGNNTPGRGNIVFFPQINGDVGDPDLFTADPSFRTSGVTVSPALPAESPLPIYNAQYFDLPDLSTPYLQTPGAGVDTAEPGVFVNLLQDAIATTSISNEYITDPTINAFTDWTFSQPTRRYGVVADYRPLVAGTPGPIRRVYLTGSAYYDSTNTSVNSTPGRTFQICVATGSGGVNFYDREEFTQAVSANFVISPSPAPDTFRLCGETSVLTFNSPGGASVLGAEIARTDVTAPQGIRDGWARVGTPGAVSAGLPILGKAFTAASTGSLNVSGSWEHRYSPVNP